MTGPLGPMDDDGVVDLLRAAGHGGRDASPADVSRAMAAGTKIRRRRQAMQVVGSGLAIVAVLGVGIATVSALDSDPRRETVATAPDDATPTPAPKTTSLGTLLAEDLGTGWKASGDHATLDASLTTLPAGYTVRAFAFLIDRADYENNCGITDGEQLCERVRQNGIDIDLKDSVDRDGAVENMHAVSWAFRPVTNSKVAMISLAVEGSGITAEQSDAHVAAIREWYSSVRPGLLNAATDQRITDALTRAWQDKSNEVPSKPMRAAALLAEDMGKGWTAEQAAVVLNMAADAADGLPEGHYSARAEAGIINQASFDLVCKARAGLKACTSRELSGGRTVFSRSWADRNIDGNMRGESAVYRAIADGKYLLVSVSVYGKQISEAKRDAHVAALTEWFSSVEEGLRKAVTDERLAAMVVELDNQDTAADPGTVSPCDAVPAPPPGTEYDSVTDQTAGTVEIFYSTSGGRSVQYKIDYRNDPTCDEIPRFKSIVEEARSATQ